MNFPDLTISDEEFCLCKNIESMLIQKIRSFFDNYYGVKAPIRVSGSTQKGTALPRKYFGTDIDIAVLGDSSLVNRISLSNDIFEGCPIFRMEFFENFISEFPNIYFAGHRLSGIYNSWSFDISISDSENDQWKWDYNNSRYLDFSEDQFIESKKFKYFLKIFNLAGSEVNGIVGPALELMIYHYKSLNEILGRIGEMHPINEDFINHFGTVVFPKEYYSLFPNIDDYIHIGLVNSFKYTTPNTFNRIIKCARSKPESLEDFISSHNPSFNYFATLPIVNYKVLAYILDVSLSEEPFFHLDVFPENTKFSLYANANRSQKYLIQEVCNSIQNISYNKDILFNELPEIIQKDLQGRMSFDPNKFIYFVGRPSLPLSKLKTYVPFDFLIREDCDKLIRIIEEGHIEP